jgi:hypothetical protein
MITTARNATMQDMIALLTEQRARRHDIVVPGSLLRFKDGNLVISGAEANITEDGVTEVNGTYTPTEIFDGNLAERLDIPIALLRRFRGGRQESGKRKIQERIDLFDALVNGYLQGRKGKLSRQGLDKLSNHEHGSGDPEMGYDDYVLQPVASDPRKFTCRLWLGNPDGGVARALLSDKFGIMDNFDAAAAMVQGFEEAGLDASQLVITGDLSERRMYLKVHAPEIFTLAPELLKGYRSPFDDEGMASQRQHTVADRIAAGNEYIAAGSPRDGHNFYKAGEEPIVHAGFVLSNSEVGQGSFQITPQVVVLKCTNGLTQMQDSGGRRHVGAKLEEGVINWSQRTQQKNLELITSMTTDAVARFLSVGYVEEVVARLEEKSGKPIAKPQEVIEHVAKQLKFDDVAVAGIMEHFFMGGQRTAGGVMQAITSYSQTVESADEAHELDALAVQAMELAYAAS